MKKINLLKDEKGVSPIVATLLLLMITVALIGIAFVWISMVQTSTQASIQQDIERQEITTLADIDLKLPDLVQDGAYPIVTVYNQGTITLTNLTSVLVTSDGTKELPIKDVNRNTITTLAEGESGFIELGNVTTVFYPVKGDSIIVSSKETVVTKKFLSDVRRTGKTDVDTQWTIKTPNPDDHDFDFAMTKSTTLNDGETVTAYTEWVFEYTLATPSNSGSFTITVTDAVAGITITQITFNVDPNTNSVTWRPTLYGIEYSDSPSIGPYGGFTLNIDLNDPSNLENNEVTVRPISFSYIF
ncbi:MAG: archaellin/type IV pilin N-terminal domain-containing protein [Candidatus Hydrothermarchaeota archaeon]